MARNYWFKTRKEAEVAARRQKKKYYIGTSLKASIRRVFGGEKTWKLGWF